MKKILALILTIASIASMLVMPVFAEETSTLSQDQLTLLSYVGVYDENADLTQAITKAEFAGLLAKVAFGLDVDPELYATGDKAADVKSDHLYYTEICALLSSGYISTNKFGSFLPDTELNINTAYEFILRTMGYSQTEDFKAGKYARLASQKDISDGLVGADGEVTYQNAYILIYNMLYTDVSDMMSLVYNHISSDKELLYMENKLDLFQTKGIVTDDGITSMYGESKIEEGYISIENDAAMINSTGISNLIGKNVVGYFKKANTDDEYELVCLYERADKNAVHVIKSENIIAPYQNRTYSYYDDEFSSKVRKLKVDSKATVIYNEKALRLGVDTFDASDFIPQDGIVRLYDNNGDGVMDVVRIEDYEIAIATIVDKTTNRIDLCFRDTGKIVDLTEVSYKIYDEDGKSMKYEQIKEGNVVSILESFDKKMVKMLVSKETDTASIKSIVPQTASQRSYVTSEDGGKYYISDYLSTYFGPLTPGANYKFYLDVFGSIVYVEKLSGPNDYLTGYLVWIQSLADMAGDVYVRIFNDGGMVETLGVADTVTVIGEDDVKRQYSPSELVSNVTYQGIMRYKVNKQGQIKEIELPLYYGTRPKTTDRLYCVLDTMTLAPDPAIPNDPRKYALAANYSMVYSGNNINLGGVSATTNATKVFLVPTDKSQINDYSIKTPSEIIVAGSEAKSGGKYKVYSTNHRKYTADYLEFPMTEYSKSVDGWQVRYAKSIRKTTHPKTEEVVYEIQAIDRSTNTYTYYMAENLYETGVFSVSNQLSTPIQISPGDGFYPTVEDKTDIVSACVFFDADQICSDSNGNTVEGGVPGITTTEYWGSRAQGAHNNGNPYGLSTEATAGQSGQANAWRVHSFNARYFVGWVYDYEDGVMTITNQNPANGIDPEKTLEDGAVFQTIIRNNNSTLLVRNELGRKRNEAEIKGGTTAQIKPYTKYGANCSRVVLVNKSYVSASTLIINKD